MSKDMHYLEPKATEELSGRGMRMWSVSKKPDTVNFSEKQIVEMPFCKLAAFLAFTHLYETACHTLSRFFYCCLLFSSEMRRDPKQRDCCLGS